MRYARTLVTPAIAVKNLILTGAKSVEVSDGVWLEPGLGKLLHSLLGMRSRLCVGGLKRIGTRLALRLEMVQVLKHTQDHNADNHANQCESNQERQHAAHTQIACLVSGFGVPNVFVPEISQFQTPKLRVSSRPGAAPRGELLSS